MSRLSGLQLRPLVLRLQRQPGPLRQQVLAALETHGRPLRWAITAVDPAGSQGPGREGDLLTVEAVVCPEDGGPPHGEE